MEALEKNQNGFIPVNTFFSTTKIYTIANGFAVDGTSDYPNVIFTIKIDRSIANTQPFAALDSISNFNQANEVLLTIGILYFELILLIKLSRHFGQLNYHSVVKKILN